MRQDPKVAKRYAKAFFSAWSASMNASELKTVISSAEEISNAILISPELRTFWFSSGFNSNEKKVLTDILASRRCTSEATELLSFLILKKRTEILEQLILTLKDLYNKFTKTLEVKVESVVDLTDADKKEIMDAVKTLTITRDHTCEFIFDIDPHLLGGIRFRIDRYVYDYSLKSAFDQLRRSVETLDIHELMSPAGTA